MFDVCVWCDTPKPQHHSKDHSFQSKEATIAGIVNMVDFTNDIRNLMGKMDGKDYGHIEVHDLSSPEIPSQPMPIHNLHYAKGIN